MNRTWWVTTKHYEGVYGEPPLRGAAEPPLRGCECVICKHTRQVQALCGNCGNLGSWDSPCWTCGRGCYWLEWGTQTEDVALGA